MLHFDHVSFSYPETAQKALDDIELVVQQGERVALLGANGSGKSTIAKLANALLLPLEGSVKVECLDTSDEAFTRDIRTCVGVVAQDPETQIVSSTVIDEIAFGPENLGLAREEIARRVQDALQAVGLVGKEQREPHTLSGGEKQRLVIAGTLAMEPRYIVFDEPCSMLDTTGRVEVARIIAELHSKGKGILQITHDLAECAYADRVVVISEGRIVFEGTFEELLTQEDLLQREGLSRPPLLQLAAYLQKGGVVLPRDVVSSRALAGAVLKSTAPRGDEIPKTHTDAETVDKEMPRFSKTLVLEHVGYEYALGTSLAHRALDDVSITVKPGTVTLVMGATGSGKSTLLRIAAGLIEPGEGTVSLDGMSLSAGDVGIVFQQPEAQLFAETVELDIAFGLLNQGVDRQEALVRAQSIMADIGLDPDMFSKRSPFTLSGGQARRVAIAGILANEPPCLLLDEPTAGLDGRGRAFVQQLIARCRAQGQGIVVVSHDIDEFLPIADYAVLLREGRVVWQGSAAALVGDPHQFLKVGLEMPALLAFQEHLGCMGGSCSLDVEEVASWVLAGCAGFGPRTHSHAHDSHHVNTGGC